MGDLNINTLKCPDCNYVQNFVHVMLSYELCPINRRPTGVSGSSATILNHIWTSDPLVKCIVEFLGTTSVIITLYLLPVKLSTFLKEKWTL